MSAPKATLTSRQTVAAVFAGIFGHALFAIGWIGLGLVLLGGLIAALLGATLTSVLGQVLDPATLDQVFTNAGGVASGVFIGLLVAAGGFILVAFFVSALILRGGRVRRPWATTLSAMVIAAIIDVPLLFIYIAITTGNDRPGFLLVSVLGTIAVGVLVWLWMTYGHRGPAAEIVEVPAGATVIHAPANAEVIEVEPPAIDPGTEPKP